MESSFYQPQSTSSQSSNYSTTTSQSDSHEHDSESFGSPASHVSVASSTLASVSSLAFSNQEHPSSSSVGLQLTSIDGKLALMIKSSEEKRATIRSRILNSDLGPQFLALEHKVIASEYISSLEDLKSEIQKLRTTLEVENEHKENELKSHSEIFKQELFKEIVLLLETEFNCVICSEVFIHPSVVDCGHTFCAYCLAVWMKEKKECPICRKIIKNTTKHVEMDNFVNKIHTMLSQEIQDRRNELVIERENTEFQNLLNGRRGRERDSPEVVLDLGEQEELFERVRARVARSGHLFFDSEDNSEFEELDEEGDAPVVGEVVEVPLSFARHMVAASNAARLGASAPSASAPVENNHHQHCPYFMMQTASHQPNMRIPHIPTNYHSNSCVLNPSQTGAQGQGRVNPTQTYTNTYTVPMGGHPSVQSQSYVYPNNRSSLELGQQYVQRPPPAHQNYPPTFMTYSYPSPLLPAHTGAQSQYSNVSQNQLSSLAPYLPVPMIPMTQVAYAYATNHMYMPRGPPMRLSNSNVSYAMASRDLNLNNPHVQHYVPAPMHPENFPRQRIYSDANTDVARTNQQDLQNAISDNDNSQRVARANRESVEEIDALEDSEEVQLIEEVSIQDEAATTESLNSYPYTRPSRRRRRQNSSSRGDNFFNSRASSRQRNTQRHRRGFHPACKLIRDNLVNI